MIQDLTQGGFQDQTANFKIMLLLIHFEDENKVHFVYSPHLDLTGYGKDFNEAKKSFEIVLEDFIDYTLEKKTLAKVLSGLGWDLNGSVKKLQKIDSPGIASIIKDNKYVSEIFDKYPVNTFHQEVGLPSFIG